MVSLRVAAILVAILLLCLPGNAQIAHQSGISADLHVARPGDPRSLQSETEVFIPGPLRSFERMAGISQQVTPDQVLPLLARNVYVQGYVGWRKWHANRVPDPAGTL